MSSRSVRLRVALPQPQRPSPELIKSQPRPTSTTGLRAGFWVAGITLAAAQAWAFRYYVSADAISYLDMSDGVMPGSDWHRLINGVWSPLYPFLLGLFRRSFGVSAPKEIAAGHLLNLGFFLFAFVCFEFLLRQAIRKIRQENSLVFPEWAYLSIAYSLFIWASITKISLTSLRADMLMSGFVYLATGILLGMKRRPASRSSYCALASVLGIGILAKAPLLPLGLFILAASLIAVRDWRHALKMSAVALLIFLSIGSIYFVPLSLMRRHFTMGESGAFNYLVYINRIRPMWYMQNRGSSSGHFLHSPEKIYSSPSVYSFPKSSIVTHPLRFDPSDWIEGVRPRFVLGDQIRGCIASVRKLARFLLELSPMIALAGVLAVFLWKRGSRPSALRAWPIWVVGLAGCAMYVPVHIEPRYVGAFLALFFVGLMFSFEAPVVLHQRLLLAGTIVVVAGLLLPLIVVNGTRYFESRRAPNEDGQAAAELAAFGVEPGDQIARISPTVTDLGIERIARVGVIAEVGIGDSHEFWTSPPATQDAILKLFAARGAKAVIATLRQPEAGNRPGWTQLGSTQYWVWLPKPSH